MFTGIIQSLGTINQINPVGDGIRIRVDLASLDINKVNLGDSVAINGTCLTVTDLDGGFACFDVSRETLDKCLISKWHVGDSVNLELALTLQTPIGGHLVSGHVDGTGELVYSHSSEQYTTMQFKTSKDIGRFIAAKGSITVDGISLTSNVVSDSGDETSFEVMLVPHTLANTTLGNIRAGQMVHLEIDLIARYLQRLNEADNGTN